MDKNFYQIEFKTKLMCIDCKLFDGFIFCGLFYGLYESINGISFIWVYDFEANETESIRKYQEFGKALDIFNKTKEIFMR